MTDLQFRYAWFFYQIAAGGGMLALLFMAYRFQKTFFRYYQLCYGKHHDRMLKIVREEMDGALSEYRTRELKNGKDAASIDETTQAITNANTKVIINARRRIWDKANKG